MKSFFNASNRGHVIGNGTVGALVTWLEKYVNVVFPENGIEYFSDGRFEGKHSLKHRDVCPGAGMKDEDVHHVACYVRPGNCEGRIIEVALSLRSGEYKSLTWMKTFGKADECWEIARAIDEVLNAIIFWNEIPEMVEMSMKVPRQHTWCRYSNLTEEVTILSGTDKVLVSTRTGLVLDDRSWAGQDISKGSNAKAVVQDWITVLTNTKVQFKVVKDTEDRLFVPDLPGYVISKRGVDVDGFYVLPPEGNENDDRTYLGYFPDADAAIRASRDHKDRQTLAVA